MTDYSIKQLRQMLMHDRLTKICRRLVEFMLREKIEENIKQALENES